jgi:hypothetical protein
LADCPVLEEWVGGLVDPTERRNYANPRTILVRGTVADPEGQVDMYIGLGTLVAILVIVAIIYLVRRA